MKKIISLTVAIIVAFSFLAFPIIVSADDDDKMTTQEYYSSQAYLFTQLKDKKIDYPTYSERSKAVTDKYISDNTIIDDIGEHLRNGAKYASDKIGALGQKIGDTIGKYGNAVYDYLSSLGAGLLDGYTVQNQVPTTDLKGYGALFESWRREDDLRYRCYCDYISLNGSTTMLHGKLHYVYYDSHGKIQREKDRDMGDSFVGTTTSSIDKHYGDVRNHLDGTQVETDDEAIPVIGEADGTQVTPDMLNPDGTVTIDGTTYYPKDFIDWDKFKDPAIIDLLNQILDAIDNAYVFDDSVPDSIPGDVAVEVPAELSDFTTPGIANVFPFCLPWDFVRGMHLLKSEPEVPHFETEIKIPAFLNVPEQKWKLEIDFKEFEPLARITRWCSLLSFVYVLILITPKICKGAG